MPEAPTDEPETGAPVVGRATVGAAVWPPADLVTAAVDALRNPGLVVIAGAPGTGRTTVLKRLGETFRGAVFTGGALAMLRGVPALPLSRAVRVRLPSHEAPLLAEAVRSRVRHGLLLLDDLQWADPLTMAALPAIAEHCRIAVTLRTPHRLPGDAEQALRRAAAASGAWLNTPAMPADAAAALVRQIAPSASATVVADLVRRAGGVPLAVTALAKHVAQGGTPRDTGDGLDKGLAYTVAGALADLTRPARTAMAALGLLGRPVSASVLGEGLAELTSTGLVDIDDGIAAPVSPYTAEVAAGLLDPAERAALHRRLATLVPPREAARHLAAAGAGAEAYQVAVRAAAAAESSGDRAELLLLACDLPGVTAEPQVRIAAARAALAAGRPGSCLRVVDPATTDPVAAVLRGEALLQQGAAADAAAAVAAVPDDAPADVLGGRDRIRLLSMLTTDPGGAVARAEELLKVHGDAPAHPGLRAAIAAVRAGTRQPGWEYGLASAASAAGQAGDALAARWSAWLLVETLTADARLAEAAQAATAAAAACAGDLAYSWQTRFIAAQLWCDALRGEEIDEVVRRAGDLTDRTLPAVARGYAVAAASLAEADGGLLAPARARLEALPNRPATTGPVLDWVAREAAWLDGQPDQATTPATDPAPPLVDGLRRITARWAAYDAGVTGDGPHPGDATLPPVVATLEAWKSPDRFAEAAAAWRDLARREEVRCLLARGLLEEDAEQAVPPLLEAERLAEEAGLVVLLGRARRALRRHSIRRDTRGRRAGDDLTDRERDVLRLVANGEPTRRIAGQLGISRETVETHIRSGMRKLGARTRTEAAALAIEELG
ncbi:LuxR C-terminal-related transcriptional regulator [Dactylosporangium fulvum]|uniref:LuxR C-terminal-related transcriptional regulator n=1 Tax=Dactylosporangium fulvum TaxID=53359 RepID=A0ABY5VMZ3_9ACTN|nr:LuxR C-terminal-related transcriptional regulator [Dactylosporangium fulvum]UWP78485.1 LuxR C-terminal-related transcriptional regulator [Dactylosporangium fulvum]